MRMRSLGWFTPVLLALGACDSVRQMGAMVKDLQAVSAGISTTFHEPGVNVNVNNGQYLTVLFVNSRFAGLPESARADTARLVAEFVRDHYARYPGLSTVAVGFRSEAGVAGFSMSSQETPYIFSAAELGPRPTVARESTTAGAVVHASQPSD
jgi:hypothetical protein